MTLMDVNKYMASQDTCVVATVTANGEPQAATLGFSHEDDFTVLIATNKNTRKYANLSTNGKVAIVVGVTGAKTVQYEGVAKEVSAQELGTRLDKHFEKVPGAQKYAGDQGQTYFVVTPSWLKFTDYTAEEQIFETRKF